MTQATLSTPRERLAAGRAVWRDRSTRHSIGDSAYLVYITVLVTAIVAVPVVRTIAIALARPEAISSFSSPISATIVSVVVASSWCAALALGRIRGPVAPSPFRAATIGFSDLDPRRAWGRSVAGAGVALVSVCTVIAALIVSGFLVTGANLSAAAFFVLGAALSAIPMLLLWLAGQALGRRAIGAIGTALAILLTSAAFFPATPYTLAGALGALWPGIGNTGAPSLTALVTLSVCALSACATPVILARLRGDTVLEHAITWEATTVLATAGDISGALGRGRRGPSVGRRLHIGLRQPLALAVLQRDVVSAARTPLRSLVALVTLAATGACWAWAEVAPPPVPWLPPILAGLAAFAALGAFSDGFRGASDSAGRPALFGLSAERLLLLHSILPLLVVLVSTPTAALLAGGSFRSAAIAVAAGCVATAVRIFDSAKGPLPISLMMPVPTPMGDASAVAIWLWQADALLITASLALWFSTGLAGSVIVTLSAIPAIALLAILTSSRLR